MKNRLTRTEWKSLLSLLGLVLLLGPIVIPLGFALFVVVMVAVICPLGYAVVLLMTGHPVLGVLLAAVWGLALWRARRPMGKLLYGFEYASL